jgi:multiple sugar transport system permease protein
MTRPTAYSDVRTAYLFVGPMVVIVLGLVAYPFGMAFIMSMSEEYVGPGYKGFVGLRHYLALTSDFAFRKAITNTFIWAFLSVVFKLGFGMVLAITLNQKFRGSNLAKSLVLIPWIIPTPITSLVWLWILNDMFGVLNFILLKGRLIEAPVAWLASGGLALLSVVSVNIWRGTPFFALSLLAGLKNIPEAQYEAATIDGAGRLQSFLFVTLPNLTYVILIASLLESIWSLGDFSIVYIMTKGGPAGATHLMSTLSYEVGFLGGNLGRAVAVSLYPLPVLALLIIAVTYFMEQGRE